MTAPVAAPVPPLDDLRVPQFWRDLGLPGLVDVHVHFMPPRMLHRVWAHFEGAGSLMGGTVWPITYRWPDGDRVAHLARLGVLAYPALAYAHKPGMARDLNEWTLAFAAALRAEASTSMAQALASEAPIDGDQLELFAQEFFAALKPSDRPAPPWQWPKKS